MTKLEYLERLHTELNRLNVRDVDDITAEYEQHFAFKLADGFSEEEISAKLGTPAAIAAQFAADGGAAKKSPGKKAFLAVWLTLLGFLEALLDMTFFAFIIGIFAAAVACGAIGVCLIGRLNIAGLLPSMPYAGAILFGVCFLALAVLFFLAAYYCFAYLRQIVRASVRWRKNILSDGLLPPLPYSPQFQPKARRTLRALLLWALAVFGVTFVLSYAVLAIQAGAWEFWHVYGWFV